VGKKALFWKVPNFLVDPNDLMDRAKKARGYEAVVLDLRGNPGGLTDAVAGLLGEFFDHDVKIGEADGRKKKEPVVAKSKAKSSSTPKLIVLIDSGSCSGAEVLARTVQLEKRGIALGDQSAGMVMTGRSFLHAVEVKPGFVTQYRAMVTIADLKMSDGKSLEHIGVTPDERILPSAADLAAGRDPVLARAAAIVGVDMSPEKAGKIFQFRWPEKPIEID
jgi:carboxyl-terminal processing protease